MDGQGYGDELAQRAQWWMRAIAHVNPPRFELDWDRAALLVIDMQRTFLEGSDKVENAGPVMRRVRDLADAFRRAGRPVVYTRHLHRADGSDAGNLLWWWGGLIREGSPSGEIHPSVAPGEGELVVRKNTYSAFHGTDLDERLRAMGVRDLVVTGVMTNICCETTTRAAFNRGYRVKFVADATGTASDTMQVATLLNVAYAFAEVCLAEDLLGDHPWVPVGAGSGQR